MTRLTAVATGSGGMLEVVERCVGVGVHGAYGKHGVPKVELTEGATDVIVTPTNALQKLLHLVASDHPRAHVAAVVLGEDVAVGVAERALSLMIGVAAEAPGALVASAPDVGKRPHGGVREHDSGEAADWLLADVVHATSGDQARDAAVA